MLVLVSRIGHLSEVHRAWRHLGEDCLVLAFAWGVERVAYEKLVLLAHSLLLVLFLLDLW